MVIAPIKAIFCKSHTHTHTHTLRLFLQLYLQKKNKTMDIHDASSTNYQLVTVITIPGRREGEGSSPPPLAMADRNTRNKWKNSLLGQLVGSHIQPAECYVCLPWNVFQNQEYTPPNCSESLRAGWATGSYIIYQNIESEVLQL